MRLRKAIPFFALLSVLALCGNTSAQSLRATLTGEPDGSNVRLRWEVNTWPIDLEGFNIKRRMAGRKAWERLNPSIIYPEISSAKSYSNVVRDFNESQRLDNKLLNMLLAKKMEETARESFVAGEVDLRELQRRNAMDFDMALISGFAYIDMSVPSANMYEYGLFPVSSSMPDEPIATYVSSTRSKPVLLIPAIVKASSSAAPNSVEISVSFSLSDFKKFNAAGFNFYRSDDGTSFMQLNKTPVYPNGSTNLSFIDHTAAENLKTIYAIAPVSVFGNEGRQVASVYHAEPRTAQPSVARATRNVYLAAHKPKRRAPKVTPTKQQDPSLAALEAVAALKPVITESNTPEVQAPVSLPAPVQAVAANVSKVETVAAKVTNPVAAPAVAAVAKPVSTEAKPASANVQPVSKPGVTASVKPVNIEVIELARNTSSNIRVASAPASLVAGKPQAVHHQVPVAAAPVERPLPPEGLSAKWLKEDGKTFVELSWNPKAASDSIIEGYRLYSIIATGPAKKESAQQLIPLIRENTFRFEVLDTRETRYKFSLATVSRFNTISEMSDSVEAVIPSNMLPAPDMLVCTRDSNMITLNWEYPTVEGLKGFRIYQDGTIVANEYEVGRMANHYTTAAPSAEKTYKFEIVAVYKSNVKSERVQACEVYAKSSQ